MSMIENVTTMNKKRIGKWTYVNCRKVKQLELEIQSLSLKSNSLPLKNKSNLKQFRILQNKMSRRESKIYSIRAKFGLYQPADKMYYEYF